MKKTKTKSSNLIPSPSPRRKEKGGAPSPDAQERGLGGEVKKEVILQKDAKVLRQVARPVPESEIKSKKIKDVIERMKQALKSQKDGVAIAAPQIGESLRIFIVNEGVVASLKNGAGREEGARKDMFSTFINPEITRLSKKKRRMEEGCLSVRWLYGKVERSEKATVRAYDERGQAFEKGASGILAQVFQHEVDHLNGILFIDKAEDLESVPPEDKDDE